MVTMAAWPLETKGMGWCWKVLIRGCDASFQPCIAAMLLLPVVSGRFEDAGVVLGVVVPSVGDAPPIRKKVTCYQDGSSK